MDLNKYAMNEIAAAFKLYFQVLPSPLLTYELYPRFMAAVCLEDELIRNDYYNALLSSVPPLRRNLCHFLLKLLQEVSKHKDKNKMGSKNLGIIFGPLLLKKKGTDNDAYLSYLHYSKYIIKSATHFIDDFDLLFKNVPSLISFRALTNYRAQKQGELDFNENSIVHIFKKTETECLAESDGRFGTLPIGYLFDLDGNFSHSLPPKKLKVKIPKKRARRSTVDSGSSTSTPNLNKSLVCYSLFLLFLCHPFF